MNAPTIAEVEAAVRCVLGPPGGPGAAGRSDVFAGPVFGLRHAEALATTTREVRVVPATVVTPLARDFLKRAGIVVRVVSRAEAPPAGEWGFAIAVDSGPAVALRRALLAEDREPWTEVGDDHREAARWVRERAERAAIAVTREASIATWEACRIEGVRAATVVDADSAARAARHLGANLLVVEIQGQSIASLKFLMGAFRRAARAGGGYEDRRSDRSSDALPGPSNPAQRALGDRRALDVRGPDRGHFPTR